MRRSNAVGICLLCAMAVVVSPWKTHAQAIRSGARDEGAITPRCVRLELYVRARQSDSEAARIELERFASQRSGIGYRVYEVGRDPVDQQRLAQIYRYYHLAEQTPLVYGCGRPVVGFQDAASFEKQLKELITITVYVRAGCPHCADAKAYLSHLQQRFSGFEVRLRDTVADARAAVELQELVRKHRTAAASLPVFHACDELVIGFDSAATTGPRWEAVLQRWTRDCPPPQPVRETGSVPPVGPPTVPAPKHPRVQFVSYFQSEGRNATEDMPLPLPTKTQLPLPEGGPRSQEAPRPQAAPNGEVTLPFFGRVRAEHIGLPMFTVAVGLVDGFNPCAMWVLLFLISILVNLRSRWKILSVAGTFVLVSGAAYFAFMAAWLNVFLLVGLLTWVRLALASLAIVVGLIHVKDFFAFKRGITLSIPESAKPGIYQRVRRIVTAENLVGAVIGAAVLAVLVNIIELLCTAGLPALYAQVLAAQELPLWTNYAYLLLYNAAYMADDCLMVGVVVLTLERHKLQERHGRWLKLISGVAILALGVIMLLRPDWLGMST